MNDALTRSNRSSEHKEHVKELMQFYFRSIVSFKVIARIMRVIYLINIEKSIQYYLFISTCEACDD